MSSKSKRRVTVDPGNSVSEDAEKRKPSVFERLGPGAGQRKPLYSSESYDSEREKKCRPFLLTGECPYGATCKYKHVQLSSKSKSREEDPSPENLRLKLKGGQSERSSDKRKDSDTESHDPPSRSASHARREKDSVTEGGDRPDRSSSHSRRDKETKIRSQVVVKKSENADSDDSGDDSESNWFNSLDYKKELELEQKRQQLQRELSQLDESEVDTIAIQKKAPVPQSGSESSPERGRPSKRGPSPHEKRVSPHEKRISPHEKRISPQEKRISPHEKPSTSPGGRGKKEKKKHRTKSPPDLPTRDKKPSSPVMDKSRDHKKKHEAENEAHKKHKKKKERKRSMSPPPEPSRGKKKDKWEEQRDSAMSRGHSDSRRHSQTKPARSSSSDSSVSPPRSKDGKVKGKGKGKKKKSRGGKGDSDSDESHTKSRKWLSPLKKTLKLKKGKVGSVAGDSRADDEPSKQRSPPSPKLSRRGDRRDLSTDNLLPPSRAHDHRKEDRSRSRGQSLEKRDKKKGRRSESPPPDRGGGSSKRGESTRDSSYTRKGRRSESPDLPPERSSSSKRGDTSHELPFSRRKPDQREGRGRAGADERPKRSSPTRQSEMYSPSQLDKESPARGDSSRQSSIRGREPPRNDDNDSRRSGQDRDRDGRRGEKFESHASSSSQDRSGQDRFARRGNTETAEQFTQDRPRFDADRNRWEFREGRGQESSGDREQRGRRGEHYERGAPSREQPRSEGASRDGAARDVPFDRQEAVRGSGGRDGREMARESDGGRDRGREAARDRGDTRDRDGRLPLTEGGKYSGGSFGTDNQRRSGPWEPGSRDNRGGAWPGDRSDNSRDLGGGRIDVERGRLPAGSGSVGSGSSGGRAFRDEGREGGDRRGRDMSADGRQPMETSRMDRMEGRPADARLDRGERGDNRMERGEARMDRGDNRGEVRLDRGEPRLERDARNDRNLGRVEGRHERSDSRPDRVERGDARLDRPDNRTDLRMDRGDNLERRDKPDQRGFRPSRGMGPGSGESRGNLRGHGLPEPRNFDFEHHEGVGGRPGEREGRMERERDMGMPPRERDLPVMGGPPPRDRFMPNPDFRREEPGFRENFPEGRRDDRFGPEGVDLPPRGDRRFDDMRDDRMQGRGQGDDRQGRERMMLRRGGHYEFGRGPEPDMRTPDLPMNQRRGPLLPTPLEEPIGNQEEGFECEPPRGGRDGPRDMRGRRDPREAEFGMDMGRGGRDMPREGAWDRDIKDGRPVGRDGGRDMRRNRIVPSEELPLDPNRNRDADRMDPQRRDRDRERGPFRRDLGGAHEPDMGSKRPDKKDEREKEEESKMGESSDVRSTRSAEDAREPPGFRGARREGEIRGGAAGPRAGRERDAASDGKRSPGRSKHPSPSPSSSRQPIKSRSLSPKQQNPNNRDSNQPPSKHRSPSRTTNDGPGVKPAPGDRSRTPLGTKRKMDDDLRSPRGKEERKSPAPKRAREDSRSPGRRTSRHPSPAGSHHSLGSHSSLERRKRQGLTQKEPETRFFSTAHDRDSPSRRDRDSPARRERDREREKEGGKVEKGSEGNKGDSDKTEGSRKRGRSPPRSQGRGSDAGDRNRKRWKGDGTWSEAEGADGIDKDAHRQKAIGSDQGRLGDAIGGDASGNLRPDAGKGLLAAPTSVFEMGKPGRPPRGDGYGGRGGEDRGPMEERAIRGEDSFHRGQGRLGLGGEGGDGHADNSFAHDADDKDASLGNMLYEDDYEKISSDESDFEAEDGDKQTQNIVSVLDIDWASLSKQPAPKQTPGSLLKRFHPASVFCRTGISRALAGDDLFRKVEAICREGLSVEDNADSAADKENKDQSADSTKVKSVVMDTRLQSDVPVLHMAMVRQKRERANLLRNLGPFRRALCARRDLEIRRQLCKVDKVYEQPAVFPVDVMDTDLCKLSIQLFRQGRDFVERKDSECDSKIGLSL